MKKTKAKTKKSTRARRQGPVKTAKSADDIIDLIIQDHKALKKLIKTMKDPDAGFEDRKRAFDEFGPRLLAHAKPEERTWYVHMKDSDDLRLEGLEGDVEHSLAELMLESAKRTGDQDLWSAQVKVLAELVEHHIEEEEEDQLPRFRKHSDADERAVLGREYRQVQAEVEASTMVEDRAAQGMYGQARH